MPNKAQIVHSTYTNPPENIAVAPLEWVLHIQVSWAPPDSQGALQCWTVIDEPEEKLEWSDQETGPLGNVVGRNDMLGPSSIVEVE